ncbi:MAG: hypothetical protein PHU85_05860 [Phycisphaerae bacterium]|nr:hypothetical protein [Phycisphaerae bacterium]
MPRTRCRDDKAVFVWAESREMSRSAGRGLAMGMAIAMFLAAGCIGFWATVGTADDVKVIVIKPNDPTTQPAQPNPDGTGGQPAVAPTGKPGEVTIKLDDLIKSGQLKIEGADVKDLRIQVVRGGDGNVKVVQPGGDQPAVKPPVVEPQPPVVTASPAPRVPQTGIQQLDAPLSWAGQLTDEQMNKLKPVLEQLRDQYRDAAKPLREQRDDATKRMQEAAGEFWRLKQAGQDASKALAANKAAAEDVQRVEREMLQTGEKLADGAMDKILPVLTDDQAKRFKGARENFLDTPELRAKRWAQGSLNSRFYGVDLTEEQKAKAMGMLIKDYPQYEQQQKPRGEKMRALSEKLGEAMTAKDAKAQEAINAEMAALRQVGDNELRVCGDRIVEQVMTKEQARRFRNKEASWKDTPDGKVLRFVRDLIGDEAAEIELADAQKAKIKDILDTREAQAKEARDAAAKLTPEEHKEMQKRYQEQYDLLKKAQDSGDKKAYQAVLDEMAAPSRKAAQERQALRDKVEAILTADQRKAIADARAKTLTSANESLIRSTVGSLAKMQLDDTQNKKVQELADAVRKVLDSLPLDQHKERNDLTQQFRKDVFAVLNEAQKAEYRKSWGTP